MKGHNPYGQPREPVSRSPAVVSMVQDDHPALAQGLLRALQEQRAAASDQLILAKDWADFEKRRGLVQGFDAAIALCQATKARLEA